MKFAKKARHSTQMVSAFHVFLFPCCFLFLTLIPLFSGCAPQITTEIQEWGIVGYEDAYNTTQVINPNGVIVDESRTPAGAIPVYGYYTQEVVIDPETRNSHDVFSKIIGGVVYGTVIYVLLKCLK